MFLNKYVDIHPEVAAAIRAGKPVVAKVGLDVLLRDLVLACIETIAPKSFDAKELYTSFKPILDVCLQSCENLEDALKWQLDELVKEGIL